jgi:hypothetical protein
MPSLFLAHPCRHPYTFVSTLKIAAVNPLDYASEIKELFLTHDRPEFPEFFDRAYPSAVRAGASSWIGLDSGGDLVMHVARFPHCFAMDEHTLVAGVLVNLMVAKSHRTFRPAAALLQRVIADSRGEPGIDFLYADPASSAALVLKAAGFSTLGTLGRFAFPLGGQRWYSEALARLYRSIIGGRAWNRGVEAVEHSARAFDAGAFERPLGTAPTVRPFRPAELYRRRMAGYPGDTDYWFTIHRNARAGSVAGAILVRGFSNHIAKIISLSREPSLPLSAIVPALVAALRRAGYLRLWVSTLLGTAFARDLSRVGFISRRDASPLLAYALTDRGACAVRSVSRWEITDLDCDRGDPLVG